jgi:hypothetical protein
MIQSDYGCPTHGPFEQMVASPAPDDVPCPSCGAAAPWIPFPVMGRMRMVEAARGGSDRPSGPLAMDTRELGEGMPLSEWRAKREQAWREHDHKRDKDMLS